MMRTKENVEIRLEDYKAPLFTTKAIDLCFQIFENQTLVKSTQMIHRLNDSGQVLELFGKDLELKSILLNSQTPQYELTQDSLKIQITQESNVLEIETVIFPQKNTALEGLYQSGDIFCTQCEPEGFRRMTFFQDRPDVMAKFKTRIEADLIRFPVLLSNGNLIDSGSLPGNRHFVVWEDPFLKPSYLFALVAGKLGRIEDYFVTMSGKKVKLEIYCDPGNEHLCHHAMESLKKSMKWDEDKFGREYDLDIYMIVSVDSFNMGAMENKGLNIFNSAYTLVDQNSATDLDYFRVESVIGHEYFHNWTGNRITCRDWFQLTLKEGLTVYRDQEFSSDMVGDRTVCRIEQVNALKTAQFSEDAGPTAHPIKPKTYVEMNNFYTATVYEKGAEVIRMVETLLGKEGFRKGMDRYFKKHDGQAVTTEDFIESMSEANGHYDFEQFKLWYDRKGTPVLNIKGEQRLEGFYLTIKQENPNYINGPALVIPLKLGFLNQSGQTLQVHHQAYHNGLLVLKNWEETFVFNDIKERPILSLNREFRAPVIIHYEHTLEDLFQLMISDTDDFNRYEASRMLIKSAIDDLMYGNKVSETFYQAYEKVILDQKLDHWVKSLCLEITPVMTLKNQYEKIDFQKLSFARDTLQKSIAERFYGLLEKLYLSVSDKNVFSVDARNMGMRNLKNEILKLVAPYGHEDLAMSQFRQANNMTDRLGSLESLMSTPYRQQALDEFEKLSKGQLLVFQKWIKVQSCWDNEKVFELMDKIVAHPRYDKKIPNNFYALVSHFSRGNLAQFHHPSGRGYRFVIDQLINIDPINPSLSSRVLKQFSDMSRLNEKQANLMKYHLERMNKIESLSKNAREILNQVLK